MALRLYNTLSRKKEVFQPQKPEQVSMYVCGPTVYSQAHIGNARPAVVFDLLYRLLLFLYPKVLYARNVTDIDDKIIARSEEEDIAPTELSARYYKIYQQDMQALNVLSPSLEPWATSCMESIFALTEQLIQKDYAYQAAGHVLFHVPAYRDYGRLSRRSREDMIAGARVEVAPYKKDPADFVLWKPSSSGQPGWDSPWGRGRPGWHIECSAMIHSCFGVTVDIHGGGQDLIFPHHENEIAQSACSHQGQACARFWLHNGFVRINQEKMSKSLGNVFLVSDILKEVPGETIRLALLSHHYRGPLDWNAQLLRQAQYNLDRFYECLQCFSDGQENSEQTNDNETGRKRDPDCQPPEDFMQALKDDLNTSSALAVMHSIAGEANSAKTRSEQRKHGQRLLACGTILGILQQRPLSWFQTSPRPQELSKKEIEALILRRKEARRKSDFAEADRIRAELSAQGIILKDGPEHTGWRRLHSF